LENRGDRGGGKGRRLQRVEKEMRQSIATYLLSGFRGELRGLVTVSRVGVASDLRSARVFVSVLGTPEEQEATMASLEERARDIQLEVDRQLRMKHCPRISFALDHGLEKSIKIDSILRSIEQQRAARARDDDESESGALAPTTGPSLPETDEK
jgi:ribosome-binding factor A